MRETFKVDGGVIRSVSVRFGSYGAGMQTELEEGQTITRDGDAMLINGLSGVFTELNYIVGTVSDHLLFINGGAISLRELCGRNTHIKFVVRN